MKLTNILSCVAIISCLLFCAQTSHAQSLYGHTAVQYDQTSRMMTATSSTEIDYAAQDYYQGFVSISLTDGNGTTLASGTFADTDRDGFVEYSNQFAAGADGSEYTLAGTHRARMSIQDPALNYHYVDYYYFGYNLEMGSEGRNAWRWVMFVGPGPPKNRLSSMLTIAGTIDANIALDMPQGYSKADWDNLTDDEKKFVIEHTDWAISFMRQADQAKQETRNRFSDTRDGTQANAFLHAYWNALMGQLTSYSNQTDLAVQYANAHENYPRNVYDTFGDRFRDADLYNNNVGRQIGINNPAATSQDLANLAMQALNSGQLHYICPPTCKSP